MTLSIRSPKMVPDGTTIEAVSVTAYAVLAKAPATLAHTVDVVWRGRSKAGALVVPLARVRLSSDAALRVVSSAPADRLTAAQREVAAVVPVAPPVKPVSTAAG